MLGIKIFVWVRTFGRRPAAHTRNFCHPDFEWNFQYHTFSILKRCALGEWMPTYFEAISFDLYMGLFTYFGWNQPPNPHPPVRNGHHLTGGGLGLNSDHTWICRLSDPAMTICCQLSTIREGVLCSSFYIWLKNKLPISSPESKYSYWGWSFCGWSSVCHTSL